MADLWGFDSVLEEGRNRLVWGWIGGGWGLLWWFDWCIHSLIYHLSCPYMLRRECCKILLDNSPEKAWMTFSHLLEAYWNWGWAVSECDCMDRWSDRLICYSFIIWFWFVVSRDGGMDAGGGGPSTNNTAQFPFILKFCKKIIQTWLVWLFVFYWNYNYYEYNIDLKI